MGIAFSETSIELLNNHPVYYHDGRGIRIWSGKNIPESLVATITPQYSGDTITGYTSDVTYTELLTAYNNGRQIIVYEGTNYNCFFNLYNIDTVNGFIEFTCLVNFNTDLVKFTINNDNTIDMTDSPMYWDCGDY